MEVSVTGALGSIDVCLNQNVLVKASFSQLGGLVGDSATINFADSETKTTLVVGSEHAGDFDDLSFSIVSSNLSSPVNTACFVLSGSGISKRISTKAMLTSRPNLATSYRSRASGRQTLWAVVRVGKIIACCKSMGRKKKLITVRERAGRVAGSRDMTDYVKFSEGRSTVNIE